MFGRNVRPATRQPTLLESEEQRARVEKIRAETHLIRWQLSPRAQFHERLRVYAGVGGLVTGLAALVGLGVSSCQWVAASEETQKVRIEERLDRALALLGHDNASARLAGVVSLSSFLATGNRHHTTQVLLAFGNTLAIEPSMTVRNAIVSSLERVDLSGLAPADRDEALKSLVLVSRGLVDEGDLWRRRRETPESALPQESVEARALSVANAIVALLRKGARVKDMRRVYLASVDVRGLGLRDIVFDDAILAWSDFGGTDIGGASFVDADVSRTSFENAQAVRAKFTVSATSTGPKRHYNYVAEQLSRAFDAYRPPEAVPVAWVQGPDFNCADLRQADFSGHPLLPVAADELRKHMVISGFSFRKANLRGAKFAGVRAFGVIRSGDVPWGGPFPFSSGEGGHIPRSNLMHFMVTMAGGRPLQQTRGGYSQSLAVISGWHFRESSWRSAIMDEALTEALLVNSTTDLSYQKPCRVD